MKSERRDKKSIVIGKLRVTYMDYVKRQNFQPFIQKIGVPFQKQFFYKKFELFYEGYRKQRGSPVVEI